MIAFRTNSSSVVGIGHLARCYRLAIELLHKGYTCFFYIDHESDFLRKYLHPFTIHFLYDFNNAFLNDKSDALFFQNLLPSNIQAIVVDDYRFSKCWELSVSSLEVPIIVFDDMNCEQHYCSLLIDGKWEGELTQYRYQNKTNIELSLSNLIIFLLFFTFSMSYFAWWFGSTPSDLGRHQFPFAVSLRIISILSLTILLNRLIKLRKN